MSKCNLSVPPKHPEQDEKWIREDGAIFIWDGYEWRKQ